MNFLLDTHVIIWLLDDTSPLTEDVRAMMRDRSHSLTISAASLWEISIKQAIGKLRVADDLINIMEKNGIHSLPITVNHAVAVRSLPLLHNDPFDRMLIAQARSEGLTLVTHDKIFQSYPVACLMV